MSQLTDRAREGIEVFNKGDWDRMGDLLADDAVYEETGTGRRVEGAQAVIDLLQAWRESAPDVTGEVLRALGDGDTTVIEVQWTGTHTGPLQTPAGVLPASGRPFRMFSTFWQRWSDGRVVEERNHVDVLTMLAQIGALPGPQA